MVNQKVTLREVSRLAQVSIATASYVINGSKPVSEETRKKVLAAVQELGYVPDVRARSLKSNHIQILALLFPYNDESTPTSRYFRDIVASVCAAAGTLDYNVIVSLLSRSKPLEEQVNKIRLSGMAGGIILVGLSPEEVEMLSKILDGFPTMLLSATSNDPFTFYIDVDNRGGISQAVDHLVSLGHQRIAYVNAVQTDSHSVQRLLAYRQAMVSHDLDQYIQVYDLPTKLENEDSLARMLENKPTAVVAFDDFRALLVHNYLTRRHIRIPEDVALIGFDDENFGLHMSPPLTTVAQPFNQMGTLAAQKLIERVEDPSKAPFRYIFPMDMLIRESCGASRVGAAA